MNLEYTTKRCLRCTHSEVHSRKCRLGQSETEEIPVIKYNYILLMRFTRDYKDRVRYWFTEAAGDGQPIAAKIFMVMSRPKSKLYYTI